MNLADDKAITTAPASEGRTVELARRLGPFDVTMIVMGGIVGSGIFMNPYVVAKQVHTPFLILSAWIAGGVIALLGAFIYAELAERLPKVGGQYAYIREAFHPLPAFLFGWTYLLVSDAGGMAAVSMTFARYCISLTGLPLTDWTLAIITLATLTTINCFGVRLGSSVQNTLMIIKIAAVGLLILCGYAFVTNSRLALQPLTDRPVSVDLLTAFGATLVPVMFAYGGWQTSNFVAGEIRNPSRNLPRGLLIGVVGVIVLYLAVNLVSLRALGAEGLAQSSTPASSVMRLALGDVGATIIAFGIAVSTLGFLSQSILVAPRVYYAMAKDGLFFKSVAWIHPKTRVPVFAIILQGTLAMVVTLSGTYEEILSYVVSNDFIFFGITAACIFAFRRKSVNPEDETYKHNMPGHPYTTTIFIAVCVFVVINTLYVFPINSLIGFAILLAGIPVFYIWYRKPKR